MPAILSITGYVFGVHSHQLKLVGNCQLLAILGLQITCYTTYLYDLVGAPNAGRHWRSNRVLKNSLRSNFACKSVFDKNGAGGEGRLL